MAAIANVTLIDTFDQWRIKTNQLIKYAYEIEDKANLVFDTTNTSFNTVNAAFTQANTDNVRLSGAYVSLNAGYVVANASFNHSNLTYNAANIIFANVNAVYQLVNLNFNTTNAVYTQSNAEVLRLTDVFNIANNHTGRLDVLSGESNLVFDWSESNFNRTNACYEQANTDNVRLTGAFVRLNSAFTVLNAAYDYANTTPAQIAFVHNKLNTNFTTTNAVYTMANMNYTVTNAVYTSANANYVVTNSAYTLANSGFDVANAAFLRANDTNNLTITLAATTGTAANGFSANVGVSANAFSTRIGASSNAYANTVGTSGNNFAISVGVSANNWANTKVRSVSGIGGQITSSGGIDPNLGLATVISSGTYNSITGITVDQFGRVTGISGSGAVTLSSLTVPIIFDSNNTGYYLDPNSGSRLATIDADYLYSRGDIRSAGWLYAVGRVVVGEGQNASWIEMRDGDEGIRFIHNNSGTIGFLNNAGNWRLRVYDDGNILMGTYQDLLSNQIRSAIFYDHNNTGRYVDPNSTTLLEDCRAEIFYDIYDTNYYVRPRSISYLNDIRPNILYDRNDSGYYSDPNGTSRYNNFQPNTIRLPNNNSYYLFGSAGDPACRTGWIYADVLQSYGQSYSTIHYDQQDTNWYADPNGTSRLMFVQFGANRWHTSEEGWERFYFTSSSSTYIKGGTEGQWYIRFGSRTNDTRSIMEGGGNFFTNGDITAFWSDKRLKKNIEKITDWREIINGLNGYRFQWNDIGKKVLEKTEDDIEVGLLAQEVQEVLPQAAVVQLLQYKDNVDGNLIPKDDINYDPENPYLTVKNDRIIPVLIEAIKGLMAEVDMLKNRLEDK